MQERSRREFLLSMAALCAPAAAGVGSLSPSGEQTSEQQRKPPRPHLKEDLTRVLGGMPARPAPKFAILESVPLDNGWRYKIEFLSEPANPIFNTPVDLIRAYLLVPDHQEGKKLPAVLAIHQDGPQSNIGKSEPAGLAGDSSLYYGLELYQRGFVVLCPDRFYHAERRRVTPNDVTSVNEERDDQLMNHWAGQLLLTGRNTVGKEAHDLLVSTDVLASLDYVDANRIGAIGHSAGGNAMAYFMFLDQRVKVGVSSCGLFSLVNFFNENAPKKRMGCLAMPGLALVGDSDDYLAFLAPRPVLLTRGLWEWGRDNSVDKASSEAHVAETRKMEAHARDRYSELGESAKLKVIYFDEDGGNHAFPPGVRLQAYRWLQQHLMSG